MKEGFEGLLRPPVELYPAAAATLVAGLVLYQPAYFLLTSFMAQSVATILGGFAFLRFRQGHKILKYRRNLDRLEPWRLRADRIPVNSDKLFLGKGFRWTPVHTQRLRDVKDNTRYLKSSRPWSLTNRDPLHVGGNSAIHGVGVIDGESNVYLDQAERNGHILVFGRTRVGKTRLAEILVTQDIHRGGNAVIVLDPKGDVDLLRRVYLESGKAGRRCHVFHLGHPEISVAYNAIGAFARITEIATRVTDPLPDQAQSAAFKAFAWRFVNIIANAMVELSRKPTYDDIRNYITDIEPLFIAYGKHFLQQRNVRWQAMARQYGNKIDSRNKDRSEDAQILLAVFHDRGDVDFVLQGLITAIEYSREYFSKLVASLGPLLDKMMTGKTHELLVPGAYPNQARMVIDWRRVIRDHHVVYVGLDALADTEVAGAVGAAMFADLTSVAGETYNRGEEAQESVPVCVHADEINELMQSQFLPLINKGGGAGFQITGYTQTLSDLKAKLGSIDKARQAIGNFSSLIMFQIKDSETAELLVEQVPKVTVDSLILVSGSADSSRPETEVDFTSSTQARKVSRDVPTLAVNDLTELPKGQMFALIGGGQLYKLRTPLPLKDKDDHLTFKDIKRRIFNDTFGAQL